MSTVFFREVMEVLGLVANVFWFWLEMILVLYAW